MNKIYLNQPRAPQIDRDVLRITIPGVPMGKPRQTRKDRWNPQPAVMRYRSWADLARLYAGKLPAPETILRLDWTAFFVPPRSWKKADREAALGTLHRVKPDRDNIDKAVLDALFTRDQAIADGRLTKLWATEARLEIVITLNPLEAKT